MQAGAIAAVAVPLGVLLVSLVTYLIWKRWSPRAKLGGATDKRPDLSAKLGKRTCKDICLAVPTHPVFQWALFGATLVVTGLVIYSTWGFETLSHPAPDVSRADVIAWVESNRTTLQTEIAALQTQLDDFIAADPTGIVLSEIRGNITLLKQLTTTLAANLSDISALTGQLEAFNASLELVRSVNATVTAYQSSLNDEVAARATQHVQLALYILGNQSFCTNQSAAINASISSALAQVASFAATNTNQTSWIDYLYGLYQSLQAQVTIASTSPTFTSPTFVTSAELTAASFIVANASTTLRLPSLINRVTQYGNATFGLPITVNGVEQQSEVTFGSFRSTVYFPTHVDLRGTLYFGIGTNQTSFMKLTPANYYDQQNFGPFVEFNDNTTVNPVYNHSSVVQFDMSGSRASKFFGPVTAFNGLTANNITATTITTTNLTVTDTIWARTSILLSDKRKKKDISDLKGTLLDLERIQPVKYRFTGEKDRIRVGFIAQAVQEIWADCVFVGKDELLGIEPQCLVAHSTLLLKLLAAEQEKAAKKCNEQYKLCAEEATRIERSLTTLVNNICKPIPPRKDEL